MAFQAASHPLYGESLAQIPARGGHLVEVGQAVAKQGELTKVRLG